MDQQNVTVSLPADLLPQIRHLAVDRGASLARFVAMVLQREGEERGRYAWSLVIPLIT
ncbi:MAG TPA: hypothetical protein VFB58_05700 [Chloroflexota bacterium]|nr:hypothetical protein [Chloroflexota bacterium]